MRTYVVCNQCNLHFDFIGGFKKSMPCPSCGVSDWNHDIIEEEKKELRHTVKINERPEEGGKPFRETKSGEELYRKTNKWHQIERIIDREHNVYYEKITDLETGEVIRYEWEPLSEHRGHGSDKKRK